MAAQFTNFQDHPTEPNLRISTPRTKYTKEPINTVPLYGLKLMKEIIAQALPELVEFGFTDSRVCLPLPQTSLRVWNELTSCSYVGTQIVSIIMWVMLHFGFKHVTYILVCHRLCSWLLRLSFHLHRRIVSTSPSPPWLRPPFNIIPQRPWLQISPHTR